VGSLSLPATGTVYVDAQLFIYEVRDRQPYQALFEPLWRALDAGHLSVVTSALTWLEVLVHPLRDEDADLQRAFGDALTRAGVRVEPITLDILRAAARLRADVPSLRTPDAIHAATAQLTRCDVLISHDPAFRSVPGLNHLYLGDITT
jgi:predicted nucleic acid-binding protein